MLDKVKGGAQAFKGGFTKGFTGFGTKAAFSGIGAGGAAGVGTLLGAIAPYALIAAAVGTAIWGVYKHIDNVDKRE